MLLTSFFSVPEIGEDVQEKNPLLGDDGLPEFNNATIEKCIGAVGNQAISIEKNIKMLEESITDKTEIKNLFQEIFDPLEEISSPLETTWGLAKTLYLGNSTLMPTKSYLTIHDRARRIRATKFNSEPIYYAIKKAQINPTEDYSEAQKRLINKYLLEARLNGIEIQGSAKFQLNECLDKMGKERAQFHSKVEAARRTFQQNCNDPKVIKEFPLSLLETLSVDPKAHPTKGPWKITSLQPFIVKSFLEHCNDHNVRWNVWQADVRKCSNQQEKTLETSTHLETIRFYRQTQAKILGYDSYVDMSMETKMAGSVKNVNEMMAQLLESARPAQEAEVENLQAYAEKKGYLRKLEIQDIPYYRRHQLQDLYGFDAEVIREYFPLHKVTVNMFQLAEKLFNVKIVERSTVNRWHDDVKFYDIFDLEDGGTEPIGGFYMDLYSRDNDKRMVPESTGWMVGIRNRSELTETRPLSALIFNFKHVPDQPVLLTLDDVHLLFNKFGHSLQHLLSRTKYSELAGLSNVEWDAVEIGGNVMTNLLYNENILKSIGSHLSNDDPLPDKLVTAILNNRKHLSGFSLCRDLYHSALDLELHTKKDFWLDIVKALYPRYHVFELDKKDAHPCSFTPIISGEWGGAYFSHVWSKMVAADVYSAFFEAGNSSNEEFVAVGKRFRNTFLSLGGSAHPSEVFRRFRGRDPSPKALLKSLGLNKPKTGDEK